MSKIVIIVGPTGSGKTALSIALAKRFGFEIINGDSVQVYKELNIGSAKIRLSEMDNIPHHLLDVCSLNHRYTVYDFQRDVRGLLGNNKNYLIVGGTGLYIKAAIYDYEFKSDVKGEADLGKWDDISTESLYDRLVKLDKDIVIDSKNRRRVVRALELALSGDLRSSKTNKDVLKYEALVIYLDLDKNELESRLKIRLDNQLKLGFLEEVEYLKEKGLYSSSIGYKELFDYLDNKLSFEEAKERIIISSRQLAKRQKTFFKNQMSPVFVNALDENLLDSVSELVREFLNK